MWNGIQKKKVAIYRRKGDEYVWMEISFRRKPERMECYAKKNTDYTVHISLIVNKKGLF